MTTTDDRYTSHPCRAWLPGLHRELTAELLRYHHTGHIYIEVQWNEYDWTRREVLSSAPYELDDQRLEAERGFVYFISRADWLAIQPSIVEFSGALQRVA